MAPQDTTTLDAPSTGPDMPAYAFHDPAFVTWWLGSLYLFRPEEQIAIATSLHEAIHEPSVQAELAAFVAFRTETEGVGEVSQAAVEEPAMPVLSGTRTEQGIQVAKYKLRQMWDENRWLLIVAAIGLVYVVGKGTWFLSKEVFRLVF